MGYIYIYNKNLSTLLPLSSPREVLVHPAVLFHILVVVVVAIILIIFFCYLYFVPGRPLPTIASPTPRRSPYLPGASKKIPRKEKKEDQEMQVKAPICCCG